MFIARDPSIQLRPDGLVLGYAKNKTAGVGPGSLLTNDRLSCLRARPRALRRVKTKISPTAHVSKTALDITTDPTPLRAAKLQRYVNVKLHDHFQAVGHFKNAGLYHEIYLEHGVVPVNDILPREMWRSTLSQILRTAITHGAVRNAPNKTSGTTRRFLSAGNDLLEKNVPILKALYESPVFQHLISQGFGTKNTPLTDEYRLDRFTATVKQEAGHAMGMHFDPKNSAVMVVQAPPKGAGGEVEFYRLPAEAFGPNLTIDTRKVQALVEKYAAHKQTLAPETNSLYLLATATTPHAVRPLVRPIEDPRVMVAFVYDQADDKRPEEFIQSVYNDEVVDSFPESRASLDKNKQV